MPMKSTAGSSCLLDAPTRLRVVPELPQSIYLETTNRCDSKCEHCVRTFLTKEPPRDMTLVELKKVVAQFPALTRVVLHGVGEPLLNPELFDIIAYLKTEVRVAEVLFNSDCISLTPKRAKKLIDSGLDGYRVSMDSATRETYKAIRGVDQFDRVVRNLRDLRQQQRDSGNENPRVSMWFVAMQMNLHELPDFVRLAHDVGVHEVYLQRLVTTMAGRQKLGIAIDGQSLHGSLEERQQQVIEQAEELAREYGLSFKASGMSDPLKSLQPEQRSRPWAACERPWTVSYVTANGNVLPCNISANTAKHYEATILGNAFHEEFRTVWNGDKYQQLRAQFDTDVAPDPCENCGTKWSL